MPILPENPGFTNFPAEGKDNALKTATLLPGTYKKLMLKGKQVLTFSGVSVLFTDFQNFTQLADGVSPQHIVAELNECFMAFDDIIERHNLEKIKTIGDAYMCAGGIPVSNDLHQFNIVKASLEISNFIRKRNEKRIAKGLPAWELRIGIHTGPIVAGVVGRKKYAYDIWGSTVNIANRMESNGEPGQVNISASPYELVKERYACRYRGKIYAKNVGEIS